jgi:Secretion system C-terminal sorting domain
MKKILFSLGTFMSLSVLSVSAQTSKISFEASEGYTVGNLGGQQGWTAWGGIPITNPTVAASNATDGVNSFTMLSEGDVLSSCGIEKNISSLVTASNDVEISFDYRFDGLDGSDYEIAVYNDNVDYYYTAALRIDYETGTMAYRTATAFVDGPVLNPNQWYNIKIGIKKSTNILQYWVNGTQVYSGALGTYKNAHTIDFVYDDFGTGFKVDNVLVANVSSLATGEVSKKENITISPNPVTDILNIETDAKIVSVSVFDAKGSLVKTISNAGKTVNVSELSTGNYLIKVKTDKSEFTKKIIKK